MEEEEGHGMLEDGHEEHLRDLENPLHGVIHLGGSYLQLGCVLRMWGWAVLLEEALVTVAYALSLDFCTGTQAQPDHSQQGLEEVERVCHVEMYLFFHVVKAPVYHVAMHLYVPLLQFRQRLDPQYGYCLQDGVPENEVAVVGEQGLILDWKALD